MRLRNVLPLFLLATAPNVWADVCVAPGETVITDPAGDVAFLSTLPGGGIPFPANPVSNVLDLASLSIATPPADSLEDQTVVFTLTTTGTNPLVFPRNNGFFSSFVDPRNLIRGVRAVGDDSGGITYFSYVAGSSSSTTGPGITDGRFVEEGSEVPAEGSYAGGVITITVKAKSIGLRNTGDVLSGFNAASTVAFSVPGVAGVADVPDTMPDDLLARGAATPIVYSPCAKSLSKSGSGLLAGSMPLAGLLLMGLLALIRRRGVNAA